MLGSNDAIYIYRDVHYLKKDLVIIEVNFGRRCTVSLLVEIADGKKIVELTDCEMFSFHLISG